MMKVMIVVKASGNGFSLESGLADGRNHFDHHREYSGQPAPCSDDRIPVVGDNDVVEITHIDADTYVGLLRMAGKELPEVDFNLMEKVDLNGSSVCSDKFVPTLLYMVGVGQLARDLKFPRANADAPTDVTEIVEAMMAKTDAEIIQIGQAATEQSEAAYTNCRVAIAGKVGYWVIGANDPFDPSRPYEDGIPVVVVHRTHYKSVSIYCEPKSEYEFGGKMVAGIEFAGHPKAAGSPRGVEFNAEDGKKVYDELVVRLG
ncbi:MAG: teicoplanin resistance protein VanZ [bacterium]|nr:teicoplanin resistance protein VanZ [bacterium]